MPLRKSGRSRARGRGRSESRGATLVEYSLLIALCCVLVLGAVNALQTKSASRLDARGKSIGHPGEVAVATSTTVVATTTTVVGTTTTTAPYSGTISKACTGTSGSNNVCVFTLNPAPPAGAVVAWTIAPPTGYTGAPPSVTFTAVGVRTVQATVNAIAVPPLTVTCTTQGNSGNINC
jgi:Flp pilus assembly pilin Flp